MSTIYRKILSQFVNNDVMYLTQVTIKTKSNDTSGKGGSGQDDDKLQSNNGVTCLALLTQTSIIFLESKGNEDSEQTNNINSYTLDYGQINTILLDIDSNFYQKFDLKKHADFKKELWVVTEDRKNFVNNIQTCYQADQMTRMLVSKQICITKKKFEYWEKNRFANSLYKYPQLVYTMKNKLTAEYWSLKRLNDLEPKQLDYLNPNKNLVWESGSIKNYNFQRPSGIIKKEDEDLQIYYLFEDIYNAKTKKKKKGEDDSDEFFISMQIIENSPLTILHNYGSKNDLQSYTLDIQQNWMDFLNMEYFIEMNSNYSKRFNLNEDISEWSGWVLKASSKPIQKNMKAVNDEIEYSKTDYWVLVLRRKFIPPYLDIMDEFLILMQNPGTITKKLTSIDDSHINKNPDLYQSYFKIWFKGDTRELMKEVKGNTKNPLRDEEVKVEMRIENEFRILGTIADSLTPSSCTQTIHKSIITKVLDGLPFRMEDHRWQMNNPRVEFSKQNSKIQCQGIGFLEFIVNKCVDPKYSKMEKGVESSSLNGSSQRTNVEETLKKGLSYFHSGDFTDDIQMDQQEPTEYRSIDKFISGLVSQDHKNDDSNDKQDNNNDKEDVEDDEAFEKKNPEWTTKFFGYLSNCFDGLILPKVDFCWFYEKVYKQSGRVRIKKKQTQQTDDGESPTYLENELDDMFIKLLYLGVKDSKDDNKFQMIKSDNGQHRQVETFNSNLDKKPNYTVVFNEYLMINLIKFNYFYTKMATTPKTFYKFYDNLLKNENVSENVKIELLKSIFYHFTVALKDENSSKNENTLEQETGILISIKSILNSTKNCDIISYGMAALGCLCYKKKNQLTFLITQAEILKTLQHVYSMNFKSPQIQEKYCFLVSCLCSDEFNLEAIVEYLVTNLMTLLGKYSLTY